MAQHSTDKNKVFIAGVICLVLSLGFILFSIYILPYLIFDLGYNVPEFLVDYIHLLQDKYAYSSFGSKFLVWLTFAVPGFIAGYASYYISHYLEKDKEL